MKKAGWERDFSLKNIQRLIFNFHLNTSNNLLLYKHIVLMTMTFDPTGPGSRVKVLELISAYGDEKEFTVYGRHWLVTLVVVLLQDKVRP